MKNVIFLLSAAAFSAALAACAPPATERTYDEENCVSLHYAGYALCSVAMPDGTRCVVGIGTGTSLSCDWRDR